MKDRELMQQALDAMLNFPNDISDEMFESIRSLRARLAQPNEFEPDWDAMAVMVEEQQRMAKRIEELETALAQPEQKHSEQWWRHEVSNAWAEGYEKGRLQREWKGLTDEEILEEYRQSYGDDGNLTDIYFAHAIEAKLKEKNNG